jgi:tRNA(Ile)-lysidine synthase
MADVRRELAEVVRGGWDGGWGAVVVGVSGGVDSLSLWRVLWDTAVCPREKITAVYIHHQLRPEADQEAEFILDIAQTWGARALVRQVAVPDMVQTHGYTIEEAARLGRYRALAGVAREVGAPVVAVGHTADDQAETVLMRWLRGSGLTGLQGMRPRMWWADDAEGQEGQAGVWVTRPWLHIWRTQLEDYVKLVGLEPCHDNSNQDMRFFRNRVRQEVLPFLAQYNPQIRPQLAQLAELVAGDEALLVGLTEQAWEQCGHGRGGWLDPF